MSRRCGSCTSMMMAGAVGGLLPNTARSGRISGRMRVLVCWQPVPRTRSAEGQYLDTQYRFSVYLLYWYKSTKSAASKERRGPIPLQHCGAQVVAHKGHALLPTAPPAVQVRPQHLEEGE